MNTQMIAIVGGAVAGLLPTVMTAVVGWLNSRSLQARRTAALNLAQERINFLGAYVKAQEDLCSSEQLDQIKRSVSNELSDMRQRLTDVLDDESHRSAELFAELSGEGSLLQRALLAYAPRSVAGWVLHTLFYMFLGVTVILLVWNVFSDPTTRLGAILIFDLPAIIITLIVRHLAAQADRRAQQAFALRSGPATPAGEPAAGGAPATGD